MGSSPQALYYGKKSRRRTARAAVRRERSGKIAPAPGSMCPNLKALDATTPVTLWKLGELGTVQIRGKPKPKLLGYYRVSGLGNAAYMQLACFMLSKNILPEQSEGTAVR